MSDLDIMREWFASKSQEDVYVVMTRLKIILSWCESAEGPHRVIGRLGTTRKAHILVVDDEDDT